MTKKINRNVVMIVGNFEFPDGNAAGKRVRGIGFILKELGYEPIFVGIDKTLPANYNIEESHRAAYGMDAYALPYPKGILGWLNYPRSFKKTIQIIEKIGASNVLAFIAYGNPSISALMNKYRLWSKRNDIFFIADCADWFQFSHKGFIHNIIKFIDTNFQKRYVFPRADGLIAISRFFFNFYGKLGCHMVMLPPVTDVRLCKEKIKCSLKKYDTNADSVRGKMFVYAGLPFWVSPNTVTDRFKDRLDRSVELFYKIFKITDRFIFNIYGITREKYLIVLPQHQQMLAEMESHVIFHGNCQPSELEQRIIDADFSILHRDDNLVTRAGFPTKVSESISLGVPVITEKTSNIADYIIDGHNGFLITPENELDVMLKIISFSDQAILKMKMNCIQDETFDYRKYVKSMGAFLQTVKINREVMN
jgi:glycosyltransferase involved in cell wall biosynthesis